MYSKLVFDNKEFVSFPTLSQEIKAHTILVGGASKTYAMTGMRLAWAVAPAAARSGWSFRAAMPTMAHR